MGDIFEYLKWRGDLSFKQDRFNEVDNAILSQLVYCDLDGIVYDLASNQKILLSDMYQLFLQKFSDNQLSHASYVVKQANKVFQAVVETNRFKNLYVSKYVSEINEAKESQFSAIKFDSEDFTYIAFSGTDTSLVGWKENFNMIYLKETPAQNKACYYLKTVIDECHSNLFVGGHSKGGNLSIYAVLNSEENIRKRITRIYNNDGPGVDFDEVNQPVYLEIVEKIHTLVPSFSWVGILFEHKEVLKIVSSNKQGLIEHDLTTWRVNQNKFVRAENLDKKSFAIKEASEFIRKLPNDESKKLIDKIFDIISNHAIDENGKFKKFGFADFIKVITELDKLSIKNKKIIYKFIKIMISGK